MLVSLRLYVSPKKQVADTGPESPMKWCRQALDHKTPETELACRTLISRLDQSECYTSVYFFLLLSFFYSWCTCRNSFTDSELFVYANWRSSLIWPVQWEQTTELNLSLTETREEKIRNFLPKVQIREPTAGVSSVFFCVSIITGQLHSDCVGLFKLPDVATLLLVNVCVVRLCTLPTCWHKPVSEPTATIHYLSCSQLPPPAHCRAPDNKGSHTWTEWQHEVKGWIKLPSLLVCSFFFLFFMTALGHKRLTW